VKSNGDVEISVIQHPRVDVRRLRDQQAVIQLQQAHPEMRMRCETFLRGNEYFGGEAVGECRMARRLLRDLVDGVAEKTKVRPVWRMSRSLMPRRIY